MTHVTLATMLSGSEIILILAGFLFWAAVVGVVVLLIMHFSSKSRKLTPSSTPAAEPATQILPRKCPQCGAELKPDVSEGLCPACLLQRGIATEGGAPPGTPPFVPPTIPELAGLFPQLEIFELIGKGGMGAVYKARQPALDRFVALKILAPRSGGDLDFASRFTREAQALAKLNHPNIVAVHDFGIAGQASSLSPSEKKNPQSETGRMPVLHYFIMEFVDGPNLRQVEQAGKLSPREALEIIPQICAALQFAHDEGIVHRDIKPENVLLDKKGRVKIADFGLAKILGSDPKDFRLTGARDVVGTPHYMAPEQVEKPQEVDHRADIYSLGVVFYEMLTGELPLGKFQPPSSCTHRVQIDVRLDEVVLHALEKAPERRYQQASQVKTAVETIANSQGSPVAYVGATPNPSPGRDYRTKQSLLGLPLAHVAWGVDPVTHRPRVAKGWIAVGSKAKGLAAVGIEAYGLIAVGLIAGGIFPTGLLAFGVWSVGLVAYGVMSTGLLAVALIQAVGLLSLGHRSVGLVHFGIDAPVFFLLGLPIAAIWFLRMNASAIKRAWPSAGQPAAATTSPSDRFWRRFAVVMACVVLIPIAVAVVGLLAAIAIPNFVKGRNQVLAHRQVEVAKQSATNAPAASAETWAPTLAPGGKLDLQKILDEAKTLMSQGRYEESLQRHIWHFNHASEFGDSYQSVVRLTSGLSDWEELGRRYPKAKQALIELRDTRTREIAEGNGYIEMFQEVQGINHELQDDDATYALFKTIREKDPKLAGQAYFFVEDLLVSKGDYDWCLKCIGDPQAHFESCRRGLELQRESQQRTDEMRKKFTMPVPPRYGVDMGQMATNNFVGQIRTLVEILVAAGHRAQAEKIRDQALATLDDPRLKSAVNDAVEKIQKTSIPIHQP